MVENDKCLMVQETKIKEKEKMESKLWLFYQDIAIYPLDVF